MIILLIFLYLLLFILLLAIFFISIPYKYIINYNYKENLNFRLAIRTFFFRIVYQKQDNIESTYLKIFTYKKEFAKESEESIEKQVEDMVVEKIEEAKKAKLEKEKKKEKEKEKKKKLNFPLKVLSIENVKHVLRFVIDLLKMIFPRHLKLYFLIGLEEPHLNGWTLAYYHSLKGIYPKLPINIDVNWEEEDFQSEGELSGTIIPIQLFFRTLVFIFSIRTIKVGWQVYKYYKNK